MRFISTRRFFSSAIPVLVALIIIPGICLAGPAPGPGAVAIPVIGDPTNFTEAYRKAVGIWLSNGQKYITGLFAVIAAADLTWFGIEYWLNRYDFEGMMMASLRKVFAVGFFLALALNVSTVNTWFPSIINGFIQFGKTGSGLTGGLGPSELLQQGVNIAGTIFKTASPVMMAAAGLGFGYFVAAAAVIVAFLMISLQFAVTLVDSYIAIGLASYFIWLGGSRWTVSYVERYFAFLCSSRRKADGSIPFGGSRVEHHKSVGEASCRKHRAHRQHSERLGDCHWRAVFCFSVLALLQAGVFRTRW